MTDADLLLGRIDPAGFSGGRMALDREAAEAALRREVAEKLDLALPLAAFGVGEIVDENMANAARVHAIESGKDARGRTLVAFGGAAPLHAARMAEKLGLERVLVPSQAGVGSAVGFLRAPIAYEVVRSQLQRLDGFDADAANALPASMRAEAEAIVRRGEPDAALTETRSAFMRYRGQGHEIAVPVPARTYRAEDAGELLAAFEAAYRVLYSRVIPGVEVEVLSWVLLLSGPAPEDATRRSGRAAALISRAGPPPRGVRRGRRRVCRGRDLRAGGAGARSDDPWTGGHCRGRDLDRGQPRLRGPYRRPGLYRADSEKSLIAGNPSQRGFLSV